MVRSLAVLGSGDSPGINAGGGLKPLQVESQVPSD